MGAAGVVDLVVEGVVGLGDDFVAAVPGTVVFREDFAFGGDFEVEGGGGAEGFGGLVEESFGGLGLELEGEEEDCWGLHLQSMTRTRGGAWSAPPAGQIQWRQG